MVRFSVVVPTYNEERYIQRTLEALAKQTFSDFEVIVKDGKSQDQTVAVAKRFADKIISIKDTSAADARNQGARHANGEILVFIDADTSLPCEAFERFSKVMSTKDVVGVSCRKIPQDKSIFNRFFYDFVNLSTYFSCILRQGGAHGNCMLIRRSVFERIGGFNPKVIVAEEQELVRRALKFGRYRFLLDLHVLENPRRLKKWGRLRLYKAWFQGMLTSFWAGEKQPYDKVR